MKIYRENNQAVLHRSFQFARRNTLAIGMLGLFPFGKASLDGLRDEPELWDAVKKAMGEAVLDEGYPKPAGEFKVYGNAHAPGGTPVQEMAVAARVGTVSKQLLVLGDRSFGALGRISATTPFTVMPLTQQRAFGGEGHAANPLGRGIHAVDVADGSKQWPLPNVEWMSKRMVQRSDQPAPAGFWGFDAAALMRTASLGKFDDNWLKHTWPHLPLDTQVEYFHTVPADQRVSGYFKGDEDFELRGMHPQQRVLTGRLPGLRARCFVNRRQPNGVTRFAEVEARLDTVWLFPELECGIVLYRAQSDTEDDDASDVAQIMVAWERLVDAPQTFAAYEARFHTLTNAAPAVVAETPPPQAPAAAAPVVAPPMPAGLAALAAAPPVLDAAPEMQEAYRAVAELEKATAQLMQQHGITPAQVQAFMPVEEPLPAVSMEEAHRAVADLELQTREFMRKHNVTDADLQKFMPPPQAPDAGASLAEAKAAISDLNAQTQAFMAENKITMQDMQKFVAERPDMAAALGNLDADLSALLAAVPNEAPVLPGVAAATAFGGALKPPAMPELPPLPAAPARAQLTREEVIARHAASQSLKGFDISGVDLSALDLSGADFSGSLMEGTVLAKSRLAGADFSQCLMQGADCSESDMTGAKLNEASAAGSKFAKSRLSGAQLRDADFTGADFAEAQLSQADAAGAIFAQAVMTKLVGAGMRAPMANFSAADLSGAQLAQAELTQAVFQGSKLTQADLSAVSARHIDLHGADASAGRFNGADLTAARAAAGSVFAKAVFSDARLTGATWEGADVTAAHFEGAQLDAVDFSKVQAQGAVFRDASARGAKFGKADLAQADLTRVNLLKGSLRKTVLTDAVLHFSNLVGVDFEGTRVRVAALEGADTANTILRFRPPMA